VTIPAVSHGSAMTRVVRIAVFAAAAGAVLCFRAVLPESAVSNESSDFTAFYHPVARNLMAGRGLVWDDGRAALRYPPGYPVIVAGTFVLGRSLGVSEPQAIGALSAISVAIAALCVFELASRVWPGLRALVAPALVATYPLLLWLCKQPSSELPFLALFSAAVLAFWVTLEGEKRYGLALLAGMLTGLAMLVRPIAIGAGVLFAVFAWSWGRGRWRQGALLAGILLLGNVLVVVPWEVWAFAQTGRVIPLSTGGVAGVRDGLVLAGSRKAWRETKAAPTDVAELTSEIEGHYSELKSLGDIASLLTREAAKRPLAVAKLLAWKAVRVWYATDSRRHEVAIALLQIPYLVLLAWSGHRARAQGAEPARLVSLLVGCCLLFWAMAFVTLSIVRYVVPAIVLSFSIVPAVFPARFDLARDLRLFPREGRPGGRPT
jgi:4-amino-4-deoxy-L-arabinose transferase-like glycosyltransferase